MTRRLSLTPSLILVLCWSLSSYAQSAGLVPGDKYHLAFVTNQLFAITSSRTLPQTGAFGGIPAADWVVTLQAALAAQPETGAFGLSASHFLSGNPNYGYDQWFNDFFSIFNPPPVFWQAIISDSGFSGCSVGGVTGCDAITRLNISGPIYNTNGDLVATDKADLFDGDIGAPIKYDEFGMEVTGNLEAWSGTNSGGFWSGDSCNDWDDPSSSNSADVGTVGDFSAGSWIQDGALTCNQSARLYGLSPDLTVLQPGDVDGQDFLLVQQGLGTTNARLIDGDQCNRPRAHHLHPRPSRTLLGNEQTAGPRSWRAVNKRVG